MLESAGLFISEKFDISISESRDFSHMWTLIILMMKKNKAVRLPGLWWEAVLVLWR